MLNTTIPSILFILSTTIFTPSIILSLMNYSLIMEWEICLISSTTMKMELMFEWSSMLYSSIVLFISSNVLKFSKEYMKKDQNNLRFTHIVLMFITSMMMLIYIPNILCLLIGWDGLGITSFILIIYYNNSRSLSAGMFTMMTNRLGDMFLLMSIVMTMNSGDWLPTLHLMNDNMITYKWLGIMLAAMTKSAQVPYSSWLPAAMAAPTPVSALVHSSTLVTAGVFILYRFNTIIYHSKTMQSIIIITSIFTTMLAGMSAIYENDMKKIIALSTLSQLGLMIMPLGMNMPMLSFFHMTTHAMFKALLFISAGTLISHNNHNQDLRLYGSFYTSAPITSSTMLISSSALMGIPFMNGYYSKHAIMNWSSWLSINFFIYLMLFYMIFLTSMYSMRLFLLLMIMPMKKSPLMEQKSMLNNNVPMTMMSVMSICMGSTMQWLTPMKEISMSMDEKMKTVAMNITIMASILLLIMMNMKLNNIKLQKLNKLLSSMMFITPMSTQFLLPEYLNLSLLLYKYLDQSWLEKLFSLGTSSQLLNLSSSAHMSTSTCSKNLLFDMTKMSILMTIILIYLS